MLKTNHPRTHIARCVLAATLIILLIGSIIYVPQGAWATAQKPDVSNVTGAQIDESSIQKTYYVDQTMGNDNNNGETAQTALATITTGLTKSRDSVEQGIPTKLLIAPGVYREGDWEDNAIWNIAGQDWAWGKGTKEGAERAKNTLFVMEGTEPDKVIISGSDVFAANEWKATGDGVYEHDWPYDIPMYAGNLGRYNPQEVIGHRREMLFINGQPLKQILLEEYDYSVGENGEGSWRYTGARNPKNVLTRGTFGVADRDANGVNKIYLKLPSGVDLQSALIEASVREKALQSVHKHNLVLRNLTFEHFANRNRGDEAAVQIGATWGPNQDILIDNTIFRWNNGMGLKPSNIKKLTVRNSTFIYNGFSGVNPSQVQNVLWEDNEASFNNWRGYRGGQTGWYIGGSKWGGSDVAPIEDNTTKDVIIRRYRTIGNLSAGLWFDIRIRDVIVEELLSVSNLGSNLFMEISEGPFLIRKSLLANGTTKVLMSEDVRIEDSIIYGHTPGKPDDPGVHLHWYNRDRGTHRAPKIPARSGLKVVSSWEHQDSKNS
ncbi:MAG: right-handed parallel beta-helix repeat-containing protein [Chloroflexota bacterium]